MNILVTLALVFLFGSPFIGLAIGSILDVKGVNEGDVYGKNYLTGVTVSLALGLVFVVLATLSYIY